MASNFPTALDTYSTLVDNEDDVLAAHMNDRGDAIEALEAKVGVDGSAVVTSHDYKLRNLPVQGGSWDAGSVEIRAETFESDVATGNAPLIVASTTVVTNLNADKVDGKDAPTGSIVGTTDSQELTNKTLTSPVINTGVSGTAIKDEDNMASDSATALATQQSIKAYADGKFNTSTGHDHDSTDSKKVLATNLDMAGITSTRLLYNNAGTLAGLDTYDSGWVSFSANSFNTVTHNLGTIKLIITLYRATDSSGSNAFLAQFTNESGDGLAVGQITTTTCIVASRNNPRYITSTPAFASSSTGYFRLVAMVIP